MLLRELLGSSIRVGSLDIIDAAGRTLRFGPGGAPHAALRIRDPWLLWKAPFNPSLSLAEAYMDGRLTIEEGDLRDVIDVFTRNYVHLERHALVKLGARLAGHTKRLAQFNPHHRARKNVAHHYDLSETLYRLFLDADMQYSCAYFARPDMTLEEAQEAKKRHIAAKLLLDRPDLSVLDIGSGWGGLGIHLAATTGAEVTGVTLSTEQHRVSNRRAQDQGLDGRVRFELQDYRDIDRSFDRIVSVGMFEHVGKANYAEFFTKLRGLLRDDGVAVLHSIGRFDDPSPINPFIRKYIFPGADVPCLSEVLPAIEKTGLLVTDIEVLRLHYAETLRHWHQRFQANRERIRDLYDERFCRMWELYLLSCEYGFRHMGLMVFQIQLAKRQEALPLTRDYMVDAERALITPARAAE